MKAIRVHAPGGPEVMVYEDVPDPVAGPGKAVVRLEAVGVNFAEVYARRGAIPQGQYPIGIGQEAAGTVVSVAPDVTLVRPGDRVAFTGVPGAYAEIVAAPAVRLVRLPDAVATKMGAAAILQGMTAHYLACSTYPLKPGDTCLVHAAAGGVGLLLCQIARSRGARVIGTVSTPAKARAAREAGADDVILYEEVDFEEEVKRLTGGRGVDVVYDGVGRATFLKGLNCLRPRGLMASFGQASGGVEPLNIGLLFQRSLFVTQASLRDHTATRQDLEERAGDIFSWITEGKLKVTVHGEYPLREAPRAHAALENRETIGKLLLIP